MAASLRKMGVYLGLVEDEYDDVDGYSDADGYERGYDRDGREVPAREMTREDAGRDVEPPRPRAGAAAPAVAQREWNREPETHYRAQEQAVDYVEFEQPAPPQSITTLHPRTYNEAVTIGEHFRGGTPVIMNLTEMADSDAKRLVDFAAGLTFGLRGRVERVTAKVFLLSPHNVTVTAQDKARIAENGFFNQS
jgi:cell division inhibitor SepF